MKSITRLLIAAGLVSGLALAQTTQAAHVTVIHVHEDDDVPVEMAAKYNETATANEIPMRIVHIAPGTKFYVLPSTPESQNSKGVVSYGYLLKVLESLAGGSNSSPLNPYTPVGPVGPHGIPYGPTDGRLYSDATGSSQHKDLLKVLESLHSGSNTSTSNPYAPVGPSSPHIIPVDTGKTVYVHKTQVVPTEQFSNSRVKIYHVIHISNTPESVEAVYVKQD